MTIAVIGAGVSGLVSAWLLARAGRDVALFEAEGRAGGHSHTVECDDPSGERVAVDTGFIVCNARTYPNFLEVLRRLGVKLKPAPMSFSVRDESTGLEYGGESLAGVFAQRRNLVRPAFLRMLADIHRFGRRAEADAEGADEALTIGAYLERERYSGWFVERYLVPMASAIWSAAEEDLRAFPFVHFTRFFANHGMLRLSERPQWLTVEGGSREYVGRIVEELGGAVRLGAPVQRVERDGTGATVRVRGGSAERFERVIVACHADEALGLLADASAEEREVLGSFPYRANGCVLHTDEALLPRRRAAWSAWNYHAGIDRGAESGVAVTYCLSLLQSLGGARTYCVTLNRTGAIDPARALGRFTYHHPQYTARSFAAQRRRGEVSGVRRTHFAGAYWGYGFHEDGVNSALAACAELGVTL